MRQDVNCAGLESQVDGLSASKPCNLFPECSDVTVSGGTPVFRLPHQHSRQRMWKLEETQAKRSGRARSRQTGARQRSAECVVDGARVFVLRLLAGGAVCVCVCECEYICVCVCGQGLGVRV